MNHHPSTRHSTPTAALLCCFALGGCVVAPSNGDPNALNPAIRTSNGAVWTSTTTPEERRANEARIAGIENTARQHAREDAMADAQATEVATRHNPTSVSTTTIAPGWGWGLGWW